MLSFYLDLRCFAKNSKLAEARWSGLCAPTQTAHSVIGSNQLWFDVTKSVRFKKTREITLCHIIKRRFNEKTRHKKVGYKVFISFVTLLSGARARFQTGHSGWIWLLGCSQYWNCQSLTSDNFDILTVVFEAKFQKKWMAKSDFVRTDPIFVVFNCCSCGKKSWLIHNIGSVLAKCKGQLISKGFLGSSISSKNRTNEFDFTTMIPYVDLFSFVFWRKSTTPKNHFETDLYQKKYLHSTRRQQRGS